MNDFDYDVMQKKSLVPSAKKRVGGTKKCTLPCANRKRDTIVAFWVTKDEREQLQEIALKNGMTFSAYARCVLLGKIPNSYVAVEKEG